MIINKFNINQIAIFSKGSRVVFHLFSKSQVLHNLRFSNVHYFRTKCEKYLGILRGILLVPHNTVIMDQNNVMWTPKCRTSLSPMAVGHPCLQLRRCVKAQKQLSFEKPCSIPYRLASHATQTSRLPNFHMRAGGPLHMT